MFVVQRRTARARPRAFSRSRRHTDRRLRPFSTCPSVAGIGRRGDSPDGAACSSSLIRKREKEGEFTFVLLQSQHFLPERGPVEEWTLDDRLLLRWCKVQRTFDFFQREDPHIVRRQRTLTTEPMASGEHCSASYQRCQALFARVKKIVERQVIPLSLGSYLGRSSHFVFSRSIDVVNT